MSAASRKGAAGGAEKYPLTAAELAVMSQLDRGAVFQTLPAIAAAAGLGIAATVQAVRCLHYAAGYVTPIDPSADDVTAGAWALTALGQARLRREPAPLPVAA